MSRVLVLAAVLVTASLAGWLLWRMASAPQDPKFDRDRGGLDGAGDPRPDSSNSAGSRSDGAPSEGSATYVGRAVCATCHLEEAELWQGSHHDLAMQEATSDTMLGAFDTQIQAPDGPVTFRRKGDAYEVDAMGPSGSVETYPVPYVFGVEPLQQLLLPIGQGRYQASGVAWDSRASEEGGQRWYALHDDVTGSEDILHWTAPSFNWNFMCAECHSTGLRKNYDPVTDQYQTTWSEIDVSCEACHGPGSRHVEWAEQPDRVPGAHRGFAFGFGDSGLGSAVDETWSIDSKTGLPVRKEERRGASEVEVCAPCHSRRGGISEEFLPGDPFLDHYVPSLLVDGLYFADGQIHDEVYVYGSFAQSRMHAAGVSCRDCHDPHSGQLKREGNEVCTACHSAAANAAGRYDAIEHHGHAAESEAAQCVTCHMASRVYMGVDARRDHSFRVPRPEVSALVGSPDPCISCHSDTHTGPEPVATWAARAIDARRGGGADGEVNRSDAARRSRAALAIHAARTRRPDAEALIRALVEDTNESGIVRATAVSLLGQIGSRASLPSIRGGLGSEDPILRYGALLALDPFPIEVRRGLAEPLLDDPIRTVRIEAARLLADLILVSGGAPVRLGAALTEYRAAQWLHADRPESHVNLGNLERRLGRPAASEAAYRAAIKVGSHFVPGHINLADLLRSQGDEVGAEQVLRQGIERNPNEANLRYALGLSLVRSGRRTEALGQLARSFELDRANPRLALAYALVLADSGDTDVAEAVCAEAVALHPGEPDLVLTLVDLLRKRGASSQALVHVRSLREHFPQEPGLQALEAEVAGEATR